MCACAGAGLALDLPAVLAAEDADVEEADDPVQADDPPERRCELQHAPKLTQNFMCIRMWKSGGHRK